MRLLATFDVKVHNVHETQTLDDIPNILFTVTQPESHHHPSYYKV